MARKVKCRWCEEKKDKELMTIVMKGKTKKYYCTENCYPEFLEEEEFKKEEAKKKSQLFQTVSRIYGIKALPSGFFAQIEDLRHGNRVFNKQFMGKRYREGYEYDLMEETYLESEESIRWARNNKAFLNLTAELNYGLAIIINNIYDVERRKEATASREHFKKMNENVNEENDFEEEDIVEFQSSYKKKEKDNILDFLD